MEQLRTGLRQQRRMAAGLPSGRARAGRLRQARAHLQREEVVRPRADHDCVRHLNNRRLFVY